MGKTEAWEKHMNNGIKGVMLVELLIAIAVLAVIATAVTLNLFGYGRGQDLDADMKAIVAVLRDAQARAITQEESSGWGVYFDNYGTSPPFYALFKGTSYNTPVTMRGLNQAVEFRRPPLGQSLEVVFQKLSGCVLEPPQFTQCLSTLTTIEIGIIGSPGSKSIFVNPNGTISYQ